MKRIGFSIVVFLVCGSTCASAEEKDILFLRVETRNLGFSLNSVLNVAEKQKMEAFAKALRANSQSDVLFLQEISPDTRKFLAERFYSRYEMIFWEEKADVAILVSRSSALQLVEKSIAADVSSFGFQLSYSHGDERYAWLSAVFNTPAGPLRLISVHLVAQGKLGGTDERIRMIRSLAGAISDARKAGESVVIAGDFNIVLDPNSTDLDQQSLQKLFKVADARNFPCDFTYSYWGVTRLFDHILVFSAANKTAELVSSQYSLNNTFRQNIPRTDHLMLRAEFAIQ